ncbi:sterol desaturase family protein [Flavobacterium sp. WV_118_3]|uniref:sterol desaturase family protein n=1 Tax=Flavobacterium sp. WV_118_3 TaxID=3151764 RepID=UPI002C07CA69|nr:sterol desaturase family protein [Flavobacterium sp.]
MKHKTIYNKGQAQLFRNKYLEMLTKTHPAVIWGMYIPIVTGLLFVANQRYHIEVRNVIFLFFGGMLFWTFFEYIAHRYLFHFISDNPRMKRISYVLHGNHHEYPRDRERLFMPPVPSLILATTLFLLHYLFLWDYTWAFFPGFMFGYLLYASMHYAIHAYAPPFKFMKPLWRNHHLHHYKDEHLGFGVSNTFWDRLFGTMFDLTKNAEDPEKTKALQFEKKKIE